MDVIISVKKKLYIAISSNSLVFFVAEYCRKDYEKKVL